MIEAAVMANYNSIYARKIFWSRNMFTTDGYRKLIRKKLENYMYLTKTSSLSHQLAP